MVDMVVSKSELIDAQKDAQSLDDIVNGAAEVRVQTRLGRYVWTLATLEQRSLLKITQWQDAISLITATDGVPALAVSNANGKTQQEINDFGGAEWWNKPGGYKLGATVKLTNGDIVKNTVANNVKNPNNDMTGWIFSNDPSQIPYKFGSQLTFNSRFTFPQDFGAEPTAKLSSKYTTLAAAKFAYNNITSQITSLDQSLFWAGLQSAIVSLGVNGGGEVVITPGNWLLSDPVFGKTDVTVSGRGDSSLITAEVNTRWSSRHLFYAQDCDSFLLKNFKIDQNGRNRNTTTATGCSLIINKTGNSGANNITFFDASDSTSQSSTPQVLIIAKDMSDDLTDFDALIGSVFKARVNKCRFKMPDQNTRCGFAIRVMTDFIKKRPRDDFIHFIKNCDISGNDFEGDYFWQPIELAGGGTTLNTVNANTGRGSFLTFVDFDKGCNFNTAQGNIVDYVTFPTNQLSNNEVALNVFADHGSDGYLNHGNKMIGNICKKATGRSTGSESLLYIQNVESTLFDANICENLNNGTSGSGLLVANNSSNVTASKNQVSGVNIGIATSASLAIGKNLKFLDNDIDATTNAYNMAAVANSKIRGLKISGGEAKTASISAINSTISSGSRFADVFIGGAIQFVGGGDQLSAGADLNIIDGANFNDAKSRSIRLTAGKTTIANSNSRNPALGDLIVNAGVEQPTLSGNNFTLSARRNPIETYDSAIPTSGTWVNGDRINNIAVVAGGYMGWTCTISGTIGTLSGVTATTTASSTDVILSSASGVKVGDYIVITGFSGNSRITAISGNIVTLARTVTVSLSGAAVNFGSPVFKGFGLIEA